MKTPRAGQFAVINGTHCRAVKREDGCHGCMFDDLLLCPNIVDARYEKRPLDCSLQNIIFKSIT